MCVFLGIFVLLVFCGVIGGVVIPSNKFSKIQIGDDICFEWDTVTEFDGYDTVEFMIPLKHSSVRTVIQTFRGNTVSFVLENGMVALSYKDFKKKGWFVLEK